MSASTTTNTGPSPEGELDWIVRHSTDHRHPSSPPPGNEPRVIVIRAFPWLATPANTHENLPRL